MSPEHRFEFVTLSSLLTVLVGFVVTTSLLFANADDIAQTIASSDLWNAATAETAHWFGSWRPN